MGLTCFCWLLLRPLGAGKSLAGCWCCWGWQAVEEPRWWIRRFPGPFLARSPFSPALAAPSMPPGLRPDCRLQN